MTLASSMKEFGWLTNHPLVPNDLPNLLNTDSRSLQAGQWFLPIRGQHYDGHDYIPLAMAKGAAGFFYQVSHAKHLDDEHRKFGIEVADTTLALQQLARWWRQKMGCTVIGITGSSGKTTVKEMTGIMLQHFAPVLMTEGNYNNEIGVALTLCRLKPEHKYAVIEMGARHKGNIAFLSAMVEQDIGVLLNVGSAHVAEFGGPLKVLETKMEIAAAPTLVFGSDDERISAAMDKLSNKTVIRFAERSASEVNLTRVSLDGLGSVQLTFKIGDQNLNLESNFYHNRFAINIGACLAIGLALKLDLKECIRGLEAFHGVKGRFKVHRLDERLLIDDSYNANPESMKSGLSTLHEAYGQRQICLVLGDMLELGESSEDFHRMIGAYSASEVKPVRLLTVGTMARWIADEALSCGMKKASIQVFENVDALMDGISDLWKDCDLIYVKGSNGMQLTKFVDACLLGALGSNDRKSNLETEHPKRYSATMKDG